MKKQDFILILLILVSAAAVFAGYRLWNRGAGEEVVVYEGEKELVRFSLEENIEYLILSDNGGTNLLVIRDGRADVTEASCPDQICVHQAPVNTKGETIVCMPHKIIVTIEQSSQSKRKDGV